MLYSREKLTSLAVDYSTIHQIQLKKTLGHGLQGIVYSTSRFSAIKIHSIRGAYIRERDVYERLKSRGVQQVRGLVVPEIFNWDDSRLILEMTIVAPPFIVDFGGAYLDNLPDHALSSINFSYGDQDKREQFGDNWLEVQALIAEFATRYSIHIVDVNPGNIRFARGAPEKS
jgi:hypothetical protein